MGGRRDSNGAGEERVESSVGKDGRSGKWVANSIVQIASL